MDEKRAVEESFARSVVWGFESLGTVGDATIVDATEFLIRDAHGIALRLKAAEEGDYAPDATRSAIYLPKTKAFPDNTEAEAVVTFTGQPTGELLPTVVPDPTTITVHMHHSFIRLPDDDYEPLPYDPRAGLFGIDNEKEGFFDYATPIGDLLEVKYARRHRFEKKDPTAEASEAVEPIVYYLDRGAPEPVRSALIDGASWWNEAFEAAGVQGCVPCRNDAGRRGCDGRSLQRHSVGAPLDAWLVIWIFRRRSPYRRNNERPRVARFFARAPGTI